MVDSIVYFFVAISTLYFVTLRISLQLNIQVTRALISRLLMQIIVCHHLPFLPSTLLVSTGCVKPFFRHVCPEIINLHCIMCFKKRGHSLNLCIRYLNCPRCYPQCSYVLIRWGKMVAMLTFNMSAIYYAHIF